MYLLYRENLKYLFQKMAPVISTVVVVEGEDEDESQNRMTIEADEHPYCKAHGAYAEGDLTRLRVCMAISGMKGP